MNTYTKGKSSAMQLKKKKTLQKELYMYIFFLKLEFICLNLKIQWLLR